MTWSTGLLAQRCRTCVLGLGVALLLAGAAVAQQRSLTGSGGLAGDAYLQRQLRSLERRDGSVGGASLQLQRARRDLVRQSGGVAFTPEQARINRGLDRVGRELQRRDLDASAAQPLARPRGDPLPSTIGEDQPLPSFGGTVTLGRLVNRAEAALANGRPVQARSDLAAARSLVGSVDATSPETSRDLDALQARMAAVEAQLSGG
jgi:hypothetical protein